MLWVLSLENGPPGLSKERNISLAYVDTDVARSTVEFIHLPSKTWRLRKGCLTLKLDHLSLNW